MKLVLLQPPIQDFYDTDIRLQPLGLCYLKAAVKKYLPEITVTVKDFRHHRGRHTVPLPKELKYLKDFYPYPDKSPFCSFHHYYHFGATFEALAEDVACEKPDLVGIASLFTPYYRDVLRCAEEIKKRTAVPILLGGSQVSLMPERMLMDANVDFIIQGEGEKPLIEFLKTWTSGKNFENISNLGFKKNGELFLNPREENFPIEDLPFPDFSDFPITHYLFENRPMIFLTTSRGCPHGCTFCSVPETFGHRLRRRPVESVLAEITKRYQNDIRVFDFEDDNLTFDRPFIEELCRQLIERFPKKDLQLLAMNGISYLSLDGALLALMRTAGFTHLNISLVSSDESVRKNSMRPHTLEKYFEVVREAFRLGFKIVSYQILGLPGETLETMIQTLVDSAKLPILLGPSMFYLTPGSPLARQFPEPADEDLLKARLTTMAIQTEHFKREDLYTLFVTARIINFLKSIRTGKEKISLEEAFTLAARDDDPRTQIGAELLRRLFKENRLYAATPHGFKPLEKFKTELFMRVWSALEGIGTQEGKIIAPELSPV